MASLSDINSLIAAADYQGAYDLGRQMGYSPDQLAQHVNQNFNQTWTGADLTKSYEQQSQQNLGNAGYQYVTYSDGVGMGTPQNTAQATNTYAPGSQGANMAGLTPQDYASTQNPYQNFFQGQIAKDTADWAKSNTVIAGQKPNSPQAGMPPPVTGTIPTGGPGAAPGGPPVVGPGGAPGQPGAGPGGMIGSVGGIQRPAGGQTGLDIPLVSERLNGIISSGSPYMQRAETLANQQMNKRGLINSSMAVGASQAAAIDSALPIAQADVNADIERRRLGETSRQFDATQQFNEWQQMLGDKRARDLAQLDVTSREKLASIEQTYKSQAQMSASATDMLMKSYALITGVLQDPNMTQEAKTATVNNLMSGLQTGMDLVSTIYSAETASTLLAQGR